MFVFLCLDLKLNTKQSTAKLQYEEYKSGTMRETIEEEKKELDQDKILTHSRVNSKFKR